MAGHVRPVEAAIPRHQSLLKGQISLPDDSETQVVDLGELSSTTVEPVKSAYFDLTLNDQSNVDIKLYVDVNGSLTQIGGTTNLNNDGSFDFSDFAVAQPVASARVRMTGQGDQASPATAGTIDYTIEHMTAT